MRAWKRKRAMESSIPTPAMFSLTKRYSDHSLDEIHTVVLTLLFYPHWETFNLLIKHHSLNYNTGPLTLTYNLNSNLENPPMSHTKVLLFVLLVCASHFTLAVHMSSKSKAHSSNRASSEEMEDEKYFLAEEQSEAIFEVGSIIRGHERCKKGRCASLCLAYEYGQKKILSVRG